MVLQMFDQKGFSLLSNRFYTVAVTGLDAEKTPRVRTRFLGRQGCRGCAGTRGRHVPGGGSRQAGQPSI